MATTTPRRGTAQLSCTPAREGQSKAGTPIFGKAEWLKAPLYIDPEAAKAAGVDLDKPIRVIVVNA